jgi:hypothetical protein
MTSNLHDQKSPQDDIQPWYKQFWPWFIIALPASVVVASFFTLWLAVSNPDHLVVDEVEYRQIKSELKAQTPEPANSDKDSSQPEPRSR